VFDLKTESPKCEPRRCELSEVKRILYFHGRCVEWDRWDVACESRHERVIFPEGTLAPACEVPPISEQSNFNIPKLQCKPGSSQDIKGNCREKIKFNFNG